MIAVPTWMGGNETCSMDAPNDKRLGFVMVRGYAPGSYNLTINYISP
jgi:hypothetical protein